MGMEMRYMTADGSMSFPLRFDAGGADGVMGDAYEHSTGLGSFSKWQRAPKELELELAAISEEDRALIDEALHIDAETGSDGTLFAGEWQLRCRMASIAWTQWELPWYLATASVTLISADGTWRRYTRIELPANSAREITVDGLDLDDPLGIGTDLDIGLDMPPHPPAPVVTTQPRSVKALQSTTVAIWAHVKGYHLAYQWQTRASNGWVNIPGATRSALVLDPGTVGTFRMVATDVYGRSATTEEARIESAGAFFLGLDAPPNPAPPEITIQPRDIATGSTTQAVVWLHAIGYRLSYAWEVQENGIWSACGYEGSDTSAVAVPVGSETTLRCVVTDAFGQSATSDVAAVTPAFEGDAGMDAGFDLAPAVDAPETYVTPYERRDSYGGTVTREVQSVEGCDLDCDMHAEGSLELVPGEDFASWDGGDVDYGDVPGPDLGGTLYGAPFVVDNANGALVRVFFRGACSYPYVLIASTRYAVNAAAARGESIVIDPTRRCEIGGSVYRAGRYGSTDNLFNYRERGSDGSTHIFDRIPKGEHRASWPQDIHIDLDVIEERGAPPWSS